jgi:hypothetical protein
MGIDIYLGRPGISVTHLEIQCGHKRTGAHEILALEAVLNVTSTQESALMTVSVHQLLRALL